MMIQNISTKRLLWTFSLQFAELRSEVSDSTEMMNATVNSMTSSPYDVTSAKDSDVARRFQVEMIIIRTWKCALN